jgi:hypothetical protein
LPCYLFPHPRNSAISVDSTPNPDRQEGDCNRVYLSHLGDCGRRQWINPLVGCLYFLSLAIFTTFSQGPVLFFRVLSTQKEFDHRALLTAFFLAGKCRITVVLSFWRRKPPCDINYSCGVDGSTLGSIL